MKKLVNVQILYNDYSMMIFMNFDFSVVSLSVRSAAEVFVMRSVLGANSFSCQLVVRICGIQRMEPPSWTEQINLKMIQCHWLKIQF